MIIAHEVTNVGHDQTQLSNMANQARKEIGAESPTMGLPVLRNAEAVYDGQGAPCEALGA
ncbi:hypothetical protein QMK51_17605 [Pseudomonas sp. P9_31]|nr:hypothetical protein [Pseudomonas sp. P9_31]WPN60840.1 hypothetical protein QMK51_17605 [Pseudomonas sp. P9_31]